MRATSGSILKAVAFISALPSVSDWLFQANPQYSCIAAAIASRERIYWLVSRYHREIVPGDRVALWIAGRRAGIYAFGRVVEPPQFYDEPPDLEIWTAPVRARARCYAPVQVDCRLLAQPLLKIDLQREPLLQALAVIRAPRSTNFRVTAAEWQRLEQWRAARARHPSEPLNSTAVRSQDCQ